MKVDVSDTFAARLRAAMKGFKLEEVYDSEFDVSELDFNVINEMAVCLSPLEYKSKLSEYGNMRQLIENWCMVCYCRYYILLAVNHWYDEFEAQLMYYSNMQLTCRHNIEKKELVTRDVLDVYCSDQDFVETILKNKLKKEGLECNDETVSFIFDEFDKEIKKDEFVSLLVGYDVSTKRKLSNDDYERYKMDMLSQVLHDEYYD